MLRLTPFLFLYPVVVLTPLVKFLMEGIDVNHQRTFRIGGLSSCILFHSGMHNLRPYSLEQTEQGPLWQ